MGNRTRIKICGITRPEDGLLAARLGVDAIGLVFYRPSPRAVSLSQANIILAQLPPFITRVALFVDAAPAEIEKVIATLAIDLLQFHGDEPPDYCNSFAKPYIKAVRMRPKTHLKTYVDRYSKAQALLLDTFVAGVPGGTGKSFDWASIPPGLSKEIILAGGLQPENVATAIHRLRPWAVDVSGGVEQAKGQKDLAKMIAFVHAVTTTDLEFTPSHTVQ